MSVTQHELRRLYSREQPVTQAEKDSTKYEVVEIMSGGLGYLMKWMYERDLNEGFQATADALKARAEACQ